MCVCARDAAHFIFWGSVVDRAVDQEREGELSFEDMVFSKIARH